LSTKKTIIQIVLQKVNFVNHFFDAFPGMIDYLSDAWNQIDLVMIFSVYIASFSHLFSLEENHVARCFLALANILVWFKMMYFARSNADAGPLIAMIVQITKDIKPFLVVLCTILFGYAFSFWIMTYNVNADNSFATIGGTLINSFSFMLGGFDPEAFVDTPVESFTLALAVAFMLIVSIVLLNLLIAIMGNSYSTVQERTKQQYRWEQAASIVDQMQLQFKNSRPSNNPAQVHFVTQDSTFARGSADYVDIDGTEEEENAAKAVTDEELAAKMEKFEGRIRKHVDSSFNDLNDKLSGLESKIDAFLNELQSKKSAQGATGTATAALSAVEKAGSGLMKKAGEKLGMF
jgi:hypothetical protein